MTSLFLTNLATWWAQAALLIAVAAAAQFLLRLPAGKGRLLFWQASLVLCVLLPVLGLWQREEPPVQAVHMVLLFFPSNAPLAAHRFQMPWNDVIAALLLCGILLRLAILTAGFLRLRRHRRASFPLRPEPSWAAEADIRVSDNILSPVTFGWLSPVILLPTHFAGLDAPTQDSILCHEVLHVRRRDWLFTVAEELIRSVLWFHPAVWWSINEIQLAREQCVDAAVVQLLRKRDQYVDALLTMAGAGQPPDLAPASSFLRKRHLKQRLVSILEEVPMSKNKYISTYAASFALLAASCWFVSEALPLAAQPQYVSDAAGVTVNTNGAAVIHRAGIEYPRDAATKGIEGTVQAQVRLDASGNVADATILSGPDELRKAVLKSLLEWHFSRSSALSTRQIAVTFAAPASAGASAGLKPAFGPTHLAVIATAPPATAPGERQRIVRRIDVTGVSDDARDDLLARLPVHIGDAVAPETAAKLSESVRAYDEHLQAVIRPLPTGDAGISIFAAAASPAPEPRPIRVGAEVQAANIQEKITPVYPPLAKAARVQGIVRFDVTIGTDGRVQDMRLVSGPPLLIQAAMEAVRQWVYKPTLLNGNPVTVQTTVDITFTLAE